MRDSIRVGIWKHEDDVHEMKMYWERLEMGKITGNLYKVT